MKQPLTAQEFREATGTDAEVVARLARYLDSLDRWQRRINLVSTGSLADPWRRHVLDSAQIVPHLPPAPATVVDLGSGAGFPGLVIAIMTGLDVHLVESDARKCAFLREAARMAEAPVTVHNRRIEAASGLVADVITARALASLPRLLAYAEPLLKPSGCCLFLKGRGVGAELTDSQKNWMMRVERFPSLSDPSGTLLKLEAIRRRDDR